MTSSSCTHAVLGVSLLFVAATSSACAAPDTRDSLRERPDDVGAISGGAALGGPTNDPVLCANASVDPTGARDASLAIGLCIANAPVGGIVALPPGTYRLDSTLAIDREDVTLTTAGLLASDATCLRGASPCARFVPGPSFTGLALLEIGRARPANRVTLDHVVLDGDGARRRANAAEAHASCAAGGGRNLLEHGADAVTMQFSASIHAMCGTAAGWGATRFATHSTIRSNYFGDNGIDYTEASGFWSDGLTIGYLQDSAVTNNVFEDNTDVALILGGATGTTIVSDNVIGQSARRVFAGLMLTNWSSLAGGPTAQWADFRGLELARNKVICRGACDIGIQLGALPWAYDATYWINYRLMGGNVHDNSVQSEKQGIVVAGAGTPDYPLRLAGNVIDVAPQTSTPTFARPGIRATGRLDVYAPGSESFVVYGAGQEASVDGAEPWHAVY